MKSYRHHNLKPHQSFGIDVFADEFLILENMMEVKDFVNDAVHGKYARYLLLGGGSNVLFQEDFHGTIIKIDTRGIEIIAGR